MSNFRDHLEATAQAAGDELLTLREIAIGTTIADRRAARLLLHLLASEPELTQGELEDALHAAVFWLTLNAAQVAARRLLETPAPAPPTVLALLELRTHPDRGVYADFEDLHRTPCLIEEGDGNTIWLGTTHQTMHLSQAQAGVLAHLLEHVARYGTLRGLVAPGTEKR